MSAKRKTCIGLTLMGIGLLSACGLGGSALFPVKVGGKYGYMTKWGKIAITPQFDDEGVFAEGLAPVKLGRAWGYIDQNGKLAINPQFEAADPFSDGAALVGSGYRYGYIDKAGKFIINPQFDGAGRFANGLAPVGASSTRTANWPSILSSKRQAIFPTGWQSSRSVAAMGTSTSPETWRFSRSSIPRENTRTAWRWWNWPASLDTSIRAGS